MNSHARRFVSGSNRSAARNALRYVSCTRSSASAGTRVKRSAARYRPSRYVSASASNDADLDDRAPGAETADLAVRMRMLAARHRGLNPGASSLIPTFATLRPASGGHGGQARTPCAKADSCSSASPALPSHDGPEALLSATSRPDYDCSIRLSPDGVAAARTARKMSYFFARGPSARALQGFAGHSKIAAAPRYPDPEVLLMRPAPVVAAALLLSALAGTAAAQTPFVPYFGKNNIHYDTFEWHIYTTDHFEIYYYPEIEQHLERVAELRGERLPASQRRPAPRPVVQGADDPVQDPQRVRAAERHSRRGAGRRRRVRRTVPPAHGPADRRSARPPLRPRSSTSSRTSSSSTSFRSR